MKVSSLLIIIPIVILYIKHANSTKEYDENYFSSVIHEDPSLRIDSMFSKSMYIDVYDIGQFQYDLHLNNAEIKLDSVMFFNVFQVDSLTKIFNHDYPPSSILGKSNLQNRNALLVKRNFGEWFVTIDLLIYDNDYNLISLLMLAAFGGDEGYSYEGKGFFENDSIYVYTSTTQIKDEFENWTCNSDIQKHLVTKDGDVNLGEKISSVIDCFEE